jgi:hypothetical protein
MLLIVLLLFVWTELKYIFGTRTVLVYTSVAVVRPSEHSPHVSKDEAHAPAGTSTKGEAQLPLVGDVERLVCDTFKEDCKMAIAVMKAESQGDCTRVGDKHIMFEKDGVNYGASYGCFQIRHLQGRPSPEKLLDPKFNVEYAHQLWKKQGWSPWSVYHNGTYLKYLN